MHRFFAISTPGVEPLTARELGALGLRDVSAVEGGVEFSGTMQDMARVNVMVSTASRVVLRMGSFPAAAFPELRRKAAQVAFEQVLRPGQPVALRVSCHKSRLHHSGAVAERVAGAIADRLGTPSPVEKGSEDAEEDAPQLILVRMQRDICTISADTSGPLLHRRGYRQATAKAPLRETLASAMLLAANWAEKEPLLDPFCGSGTIVLEAARRARGMAPGAQRRFAFESWPNAPGRPVLASARPSLPRTIHASDRDAGAVAATRSNAERAGVSADVQLMQRSMEDLQPPAERGLILTNPPYGIRVGERDAMLGLYTRFGHVLRSRFAGWRVGVLCSSARLVEQMQLPLSPVLQTTNGGIRVALHLGSVPG